MPLFPFLPVCLSLLSAVLRDRSTEERIITTYCREPAGDQPLLFPLLRDLYYLSVVTNIQSRRSPRTNGTFAEDRAIFSHVPTYTTRRTKYNTPNDETFFYKAAKTWFSLKDATLSTYFKSEMDNVEGTSVIFSKTPHFGDHIYKLSLNFGQSLKKLNCQDQVPCK